MTTLTLASLLCHRVLIERIPRAALALVHPIEDNYRSMIYRLALSDKLLGIERERCTHVTEVQKWLAAELEIQNTVTCSYVETGFLTYIQGDVRRNIDVSEHLLMGKDRLFDRLRAAYLIRWGYFLEEKKGEHIIVIGPDGEEHLNNLAGCDCEEFKKHKDCCHLALSRVFVGLRNDFEFLLVEN